MRIQQPTLFILLAGPAWTGIIFYAILSYSGGHMKRHFQLRPPTPSEFLKGFLLILGILLIVGGVAQILGVIFG